MNPRRHTLRAGTATGMLLAALLALAGCARPQAETLPELPRDTGPGPTGTAVIDPYAQPEPRPNPRGPTGRRRPCPVAVDVELPGQPDRPWDGPPRTLPYPDEPGRKPAGPGVTGRPSGPSAPAMELLRAGDRLRVSVSGHPEFSGEWQLDERGRAVIPDGGAFGVGDFTGSSFSAALGALSGREPAQAAKLIGSRLRRFLRREPRVTVELAARAPGSAEQ